MMGFPAIRGRRHKSAEDSTDSLHQDTLIGQQETIAAPGDSDTTPAVEEDPDTASDIADTAHEPDQRPMRRSSRRIQIVAFGLLPAIALALGCGAAALKWRTAALAANESAASESVRAATDGTIAILSYRPDDVEQDLEAARGRLTGNFLDAYTSLTRDVVIPGAKQKNITATARVPAAATVTAGNDHAVVLVFVDQTTAVGTDPPTDTSSCVRVTLDNHDNRWLISGFDPI